MINHDFKSEKKRVSPVAKNRLSTTHWALLGGGFLFSIIIILLPTSEAEAIRTTNTNHLLVQNVPLTLPQQNNSTTIEPSKKADLHPPLQSRNVTVNKGDTLSEIFKREGFSARDLYHIMQLGSLTAPLKSIRPGQSLEFRTDELKQLAGLSYKTDLTHTLIIERNGEEFSAREEIRSPELRIAHASETSNSSLYRSGQQAGLTDNLIMELAGIFGWDIDFALDIRQGDSFTVLYEEKYLDGEKIGYGDIVAAQFTNRGKSFGAVRFTDKKGNNQYFTPEGRSMRKAFLRSPVDFRRISSRFTRERYHPVLGKKRPHRGVDYAAARGTPIKAAGDGKITFRGTKGGYGSTVVIQHGTQYSTLYAHLSNFKRGQRNGSAVKQGDVIGFVGSSGLATGPHLHYEFRVNGTHRNPLTVKFPDAQPIKAAYKKDFLAQTQPVLAQLNILSRGLTLAQNNR